MVFQFLGIVVKIIVAQLASGKKTTGKCGYKSRSGILVRFKLMTDVKLVKSRPLHHPYESGILVGKHQYFHFL